jgi:hypothetical protein
MTARHTSRMLHQLADYWIEKLLSLEAKEA